MSIDPIFFSSFLIGAVIILLLSVLGCVVLWNKNAYLGEAISHSSLLGVLISIVLSTSLTYGLIIFACIFGVVLFLIREIRFSSSANIVISYSFLSFAIVFLSLTTKVNYDIMSLLFGDILLIDYDDMILTFIILVITFVWLIKNWSKIIINSLNKEIAIISGVNVKSLSLQYYLLVSVVIAISIKVVGALMVVAMLVIPAIAAANTTCSPKNMIFTAGMIGLVSFVVGIVMSFFWDLATGPTVVFVSSLFFFLLMGSKYALSLFRK